MKERSPPLQKTFRTEVDEVGLMTILTNYDIEVFQKSEEGRFQPITLSSMKPVHDPKNMLWKNINQD